MAAGGELKLSMKEPIEVLITLAFPEPLLSRLREISPRLQITQIRARKPDDVPSDVWEKVQVLYTDDVLPRPEQAPNLRWIQFHWAGVDHALDAPILRKENLVATTLSGAAASQMAEYAIMMMLALGHHLPLAFAYKDRAEWPRNRWESFSPRELRDSVVGIVGYGSIGRQTARLLQAFGAEVLATKRDVLHPADSGYIPEGQGDPEAIFVHRLYPSEALISMVKECHFVVVTVPLSEDTRNMIGKAELEAMKPSAYLIDVSRGGIVDHQALIPALRDGKIAGAAIDVYPQEPLPPDSPLWKMSNVILTPHVAGITSNYDKRAVRLFAENLNRYLAGLPLYNRIDLERGY